MLKESKEMGSTRQMRRNFQKGRRRTRRACYSGSPGKRNNRE
jgi:hypothetical protein